MPGNHGEIEGWDGMREARILEMTTVQPSSKDLASLRFLRSQWR